jgi:DNA-binding FrmR family transcriptional regulator
MLLNTKDKIYKSKSKKDSVSNRLNRVEGQVKGIKRMYQDAGCDCISLITQIQAARAALGKTAELILVEEAQRCADKGDTKRLKEIVASMYKSN